jgi:glycosyltransferase involved in cell wall biosynthesis
MTAVPRIVLGLPAYNRPDALARSLESLLSQTYSDFAVVIVHDGHAPDVAAIAATYAALDSRIRYEENATRLGMVGNWRQTFFRARALYPGFEYFAWVSDHDLWHPRWLQELVSVLEQYPEVVVAYAENLRMMPNNAKVTDKVFDTFGVTSRSKRMWLSARYMLSGDMIYGLIRADALEAAGVFRYVVTPDRQVLLALSLFGQSRQVSEVLWYREVLRVFDLTRQRQVFFPDGVPFYTFVSSHLQHFATLLWDFAVKGRGRPAFGRLAAVRYAVIQLRASYVRDCVAIAKALRIRAEDGGVAHRLRSLLPTGADMRAARRRVSGRAGGPRA